MLLFWIFFGVSPFEQAHLLAYGIGIADTPGSAVLKFRSVFTHREQGAFVLNAYFNLVQINLFWGLVNLLPVWPLDGGQISQIFLTMYDRRQGQHGGTSCHCSSAVHSP